MPVSLSNFYSVLGKAKYSSIRPQATFAGDVKQEIKADYKRIIAGLLAGAFAPGLSILLMAAFLSLSSMPAKAVTCAVQLEFENSVTLADGTTPT